jgi:hypothetical protein
MGAFDTKHSHVAVISVKPGGSDPLLAADEVAFASRLAEQTLAHDMAELTSLRSGDRPSDTHHFPLKPTKSGAARI